REKERLRAQRQAKQAELDDLKTKKDAELKAKDGELQGLKVEKARLEGPTVKQGTKDGTTAGQDFPDRVKEQALKADSTLTCVYCARPHTAKHIDHAIPKNKG